MLDKLEVTYKTTDQVREAKIDFLTQEYEMFRMKEGEKIDDMFGRFSKIINDLHALKKSYSNKDLVRKILRSLTPEWRSKADAIYESIGVSNVTIDGLRAHGSLLILILIAGDNFTFSDSIFAGRLVDLCAAVEVAEPRRGLRREAVGEFCVKGEGAGRVVTVGAGYGVERGEGTALPPFRVANRVVGILFVRRWSQIGGGWCSGAVHCLFFTE
ncbi:unnamed protein product [Cuscuta campestris]|uniref:UBN2 domain-containing protein n=1 Tax=Cuscuta campestris TaxID=132261 RepID=A0A484MQA9_9ASTE|nr:unnamed protein product [Cuscuta campestris]